MRKLAELTWNGNCQRVRCRAATHVHTMSFFNTDLICPKCDESEQSLKYWSEEIRDFYVKDWEKGAI
jgi:hypothetical protein